MASCVRLTRPGSAPAAVPGKDVPPDAEQRCPAPAALAVGRLSYDFAPGPVKSRPVVETGATKQIHAAAKATVSPRTGPRRTACISLAGLPNPVGVWAAEILVAAVHNRVVEPAGFSPAAVTGDAEPTGDCLERTRLQGVPPLLLQASLMRRHRRVTASVACRFDAVTTTWQKLRQERTARDPRRAE